MRGTIVKPNVLSGLSVWNYPLFNGFEELGFKVELDDSILNRIDRSVHKGIIPFDVTVGGKTKHCIYDSSDFKKAHFDLLQNGTHYFKVQLHPDHIFGRKNVHLIGQTTGSVGFKQRTATNEPNDVVFQGRVTNYEMRVKACELLSQAKDINSLATLRGYPNRPEVPTHLVGKSSPGEAFVDNLLSAKICLAFPGVEGPWTWRHSEILGSGKFMMMPSTVYHEFSQTTTMGPFARCKSDLSDLLERIRYWLREENEEDRHKIAKAGLEYYNMFLSPVGQAKTVLRGIGVLPEWWNE